MSAGGGGRDGAMDEGILLEEGGRSMIIIIYTVLYCISEAFFSMTSRCL